jgi:hypothetical protein
MLQITIPGHPRAFSISTDCFYESTRRDNAMQVDRIGRKKRANLGLALNDKSGKAFEA